MSLRLCFNGLHAVRVSHFGKRFENLLAIPSLIATAGSESTQSAVALRVSAEAAQRVDVAAFAEVT